MKSKKKNEITIHSSTAEYLTFIAASGDSPYSVEMRYQEENIWLTQKMMAELYDVDVRTINDHIQKIFLDNELSEISTIRNFRIVQTEGARQVERDIKQAETEFEKYRIVQDRLFQSDFDRFVVLEAMAGVRGYEV
jgi:hypothetical protein